VSSNYEVFARKYRPQTFDEVVGQDHVVRTLKNAIATNRLAQAYLFVGPRGIGKTTIARLVAKALNCEKGPTPTPCGVCDACKEIAAGQSLDVIEIDGASNNKVEQVRELIENARYLPARGKYKIYLIDEVHMLTTAAFNALLKTLEEPPPHVKFIFATTEPDKVLPTILSRCQRFDLRRIPAPLIAAHLRLIAGKEKLDLSEDAAIAIARGAQGGLRDAESMLDQLVSFCGSKITAGDVRGVFGFTAPETVAKMADAILRQDTPGTLAQLKDEVEAGRDLLRLLGDLISHFRNLLVFQVDPASLEAEHEEPARRTFAEQAGRIDARRLLELIDLFAAAETRIKWAPDKKLHFEIALIKAVQSLGQASLDDVIETLTEIRAGKMPPNSPTPMPAQPVAKAAARVSETPPAARHTISTTTSPDVATANPPPTANANELWQRVVGDVRSSRPLIRSWLESGQPVSLEGNLLIVGFNPKHQIVIESLSSGSNRQFLEESLAKNAGRPIRLKMEVRADVPEADLPAMKPAASFAAAAAPGGAPAAVDSSDPLERFRNDPLIRQALEIFDAEIVSLQPAPAK
jgi:DNA polymerase-3 subunit gamma/tau